MRHNVRTGAADQYSTSSKYPPHTILIWASRKLFYLETAERNGPKLTQHNPMGERVGPQARTTPLFGSITRCDHRIDLEFVMALSLRFTDGTNGAPPLMSVSEELDENLSTWK